MQDAETSEIKIIDEKETTNYISSDKTLGSSKLGGKPEPKDKSVNYDYFSTGQSQINMS